MAPASLRLTLFEPVVFLRGQSAVGEDARGRRRQIDFDAPPSQLRGLVTLYLPKPSKIKDISILLQGKALTDWPEGIGPNRLDTHEESIIFSQKILLFSARDVQPSTGRPRASSVGTLEHAEERPRAVRSHSTHMPSPDSFSPQRKGRAVDGGERGSPTLARSIGNAAARAGTAMLPPTLVREINASKQSSSGSMRSASSSPMRSPNQSRLSLSRPRSHQGEAGFDPPPLYHRTSSSSSLGTPYLTTPEERVASSSAPGSVTAPEWLPSGMEDFSIASASTATTATHPQSISAAGPSNRSILHPSGRQEARQQSTCGAGVRFDPQAINAALQQSSTPSSATISTTTRNGFSSEPSSNRPSAEFSRTSHTTTSNGKGKGKASSPGPGLGARKGIKGLLGNLLKEDDEARHHNGASTSNGNSSSSQNPTGSSATHHDDDEAGGGDYKEFRKGTFTFPFSLPLPSNLPPTLHADFGSNTYVVRAHVHRSGPLTSNLTTDKEITLVHAPDEDGQDDNEAIIVERNWEDCLRYIVFVTGKSFPVGCQIPVWVKFVPTEKVRIHRIVASLEERTAYFAKGRRVARHEVPRRWNLLKLAPPDEKNGRDGILPVKPEGPNSAAIIDMLAPLARAAAQSTSDAAVDPQLRDDNALASLMDPFGPWELAMDLPLPTRGTTIINISTNHKKSNIAVSHLVKLAIRVERVQGSGSERKLYDILIEAPVTINHSHTANAWLSLPDYWSVRQQDRGAEAGQQVQQARPAPPQASAQASRRENVTATELRRQTAPSLTPRRAGSSSSSGRVEVVLPTSSPSNSTTSPAATSPLTAPPLQGRVNDNLIELSQQWLNLSASTNLPTNQSSVVPMTTQQQEEQSGLPTYAMIDNARGSVDLPGRDDGTSVK